MGEKSFLELLDSVTPKEITDLSVKLKGKTKTLYGKWRRWADK